MILVEQQACGNGQTSVSWGLGKVAQTRRFTQAGRLPRCLGLNQPRRTQHKLPWVETPSLEQDPAEAGEDDRTPQPGDGRGVEATSDTTGRDRWTMVLLCAAASFTTAVSAHMRLGYTYGFTDQAVLMIKGSR